ncbi:MAG: division/cell wall cluster transcriptional repressor MraZ [Pseudomonadaceae bacterium]|nr:division/cell wall cluster transcriptional repressor MraZ [Pseudomonadaceae bacterium]
MTSFTGSHAITLDAKGRLAIPAKVREELLAACGGRITLTANSAARSASEHCLQVYLDPDWQTLKAGISALPSHNRSAERVRRLVLGTACETELDGAGRILIPPTLRDYAGLERRVMLLGQGKKLEIWNEERFAAWVNESEMDDDVPAALLDLPL